VARRACKGCDPTLEEVRGSGLQVRRSPVGVRRTARLVIHRRSLACTGKDAGHILDEVNHRKAWLPAADAVQHCTASAAYTVLYR